MTTDYDLFQYLKLAENHFTLHLIPDKRDHIQRPLERTTIRTNALPLSESYASYGLAIINDFANDNLQLKAV